jgi:HlyD family secretion protein
MPDFPQSLSRHLWKLLALILLLTAGALAARALLGPALPVQSVRRMDLLQTVVASGRVETPLRVDVGSQLTGTVALVAVERGETVKKGQLLFSLDDREQQAAVAMAEAGVAQAQARLTQVEKLNLPAAKQNVAQAQINLLNARRQYQRNSDLHEKNFVGQAVLDDSRRNLDIAQSQLQAARLQEQTNADGGADRQLARSALEQARANLASARARLEFTQVLAPHDGVLIARDVERGDLVQPGRTLLVLSPAGPTQLVLLVDERNLAQLRTGQNALASADAFPGQRFNARLTYINPGVDALRGSVELRLDVPDAPAYLRQDMTVSVDIEVGRRRQVLALPALAVRDMQNAPWVMKVQDRHARRQALELGLRGTGMVEVVAGLEEGDLVLPATAVIAEGKPLRAQQARP